MRKRGKPTKPDLMLSFWERNSFTEYDFIIIGSGITGLSTAAELKLKFPATSILVLERGVFPSGASTKNAGFACFGSLTELLDDLQHISESEMVETVALRKRGIGKLRDRLGDKALGFEQKGGYELVEEKNLGCLSKLDYLNELLKPVFGSAYFLEKNESIATFGFSTETVKELVYSPFEGQIDTGRMMKSLLAYVKELGVEVYTGSAVKELNELAEGVEVVIENPVHPMPIVFKSKKIAVCTNAFASKLLPSLAIKPGRGQVLVTKPIAGLPISGTFHMEEGYFYFRDYHERLIFGGGRNYQLEKETTTDLETTDEIQNLLVEKLKETILPNTPFKVDFAWAGVMGFGNSKKPIVEKVSDRIAIGVRMGGMGVAIGSMVGQMVAELIGE